jgi:hypothetical protein
MLLVGRWWNNGLSPDFRLPTIMCWIRSGRSNTVARWRTRSSSSEEGSVDDAVLVVSGAIRDPDEEDVLAVELSILGSEIAMHADGHELGRWSSTAVVIRPIDSVSFEFVAEGDQLIFLPDDPAAFGIIPLVGGDIVTGGRRKSRRSRRKTDSATPESASTSQLDEPSESTEQEPETASSEVRSATEPVPSSSDPEPTPEASNDEQSTPDMVAMRALRPRKRSRKPPAPSEVFDATQLTEPEKTRTGVWIRTLDIARRYDILGLDRVPIDVELRGREHEHTWDHRVAASSGAGKHICTICGKIRR